MRFRASPEELEQRQKSREIDRFLEKDKHTFRRQVSVISWHFGCTSENVDMHKIVLFFYNIHLALFSNFALICTLAIFLFTRIRAKYK